MKIVEKDGFIEVGGVILTEETIQMLTQWQTEEADSFESGHVAAMKDVICWIVSMLDELPEEAAKKSIEMMSMLNYTKVSLHKLRNPKGI